jgi:nicotinate-nucleotide adenylyltransferase
MRLGILGGTFDPVHIGHLLLAEQCREQCQLDEVWFMPAGVPPHKRPGAAGPAAARAEMLELAIAGNPAFRLDRRELLRSGPSYTVDTLEELSAQDPSRELWFLMGVDSLAEFPTWRSPGRILELAMLAVVDRGIAPSPDLSALAKSLPPGAAKRLRVVKIPPLAIASSDLRERVRAGRSIRYLTPPAVACYIAAHGLYRDPPAAP